MSLQGCKESGSPYKEIVKLSNEWEVWKRFLQSVVSFFKCEKNCSSSFLKLSRFKVDKKKRPKDNVKSGLMTGGWPPKRWNGPP